MNETAHGPNETSGSFETFEVLDNIRIYFGGDLVVFPMTMAGPTFYPLLQYFWLHSWTYLVPFPAPLVTSVLTYQFGMTVLCDIDMVDGYVFLNSFVAVGETADYVGQDVTAGANVGLPFVADLLNSYHNFNDYDALSGRGTIQGTSAVDRSLVVEAGRTPLVVIAVGVASAQSIASRLALAPQTLVSGSYIAPAEFSAWVGFNYKPYLTVHP